MKHNNLPQNTWNELGETFPYFFPMQQRIFPYIDIQEDDSAYDILVEVPGMKKEDLAIDVFDEGIKISGQTEKEVGLDEKDFRRFERSMTSFSRFIPLMNVSTNKVEGDYNNGVLHLYIPKTDEASGHRLEIA